MRSHRLPYAAAAIVAAGSLALAACSSSSTPSASTAAPAAPVASAAPSTMAAAGGLTQTNFGSGCAAVPKDGSGSFAGMAKDPSATAASNNPALSTLVTAVKAAGLVDTLNGPGPYTIFAPTNDAFAKVDPGTLNTVMSDPKGALTKILTYHVIAGQKLDADQLAQAGMEKTVNGGTVSIAKAGDTIKVNGQSAVVCGNVQTANGTVQIIDTVLMPPT